MTSPEINASNEVRIRRAGTETHASSSVFFTTKHYHMNHVNLIGKITSQPRFYVLPTGRKVAQFTITTQDTYLDEEGSPKNKSHWHRICAWGRWTKVLEELGDVGLELAVEGKLTTRFYHRDGQRHIVSEVEVNDLVIL